MNKKITLKNTNEDGMQTEIKFNNFKTDVKFGFNPDNVKYIGTVDINKFKEDQ